MIDHRPVMEDFGTISYREIRRDIGRRAIKHTTSLTLAIPDGRSIDVGLTRVRGNIGNGDLIYLVCPCCGGRCWTLRLTPDEHGLMCKKCVQREYRVPYRSQTPLGYRRVAAIDSHN